MKDLRLVFADEELQTECLNFAKNHAMKKIFRLLRLHQTNNKIVNEDYKNHNVWKDLKNVFWKKQGKRCAICEKELNEINSYDVEHYIPKTEFWWFAYHTINYYVACGTCNRTEKSNHFPFLHPNPVISYMNRKNIFDYKPLLINPLHENPYDYFRVIFQTDIKTNKKVVVLAPLKQLETLEHQKALATITVLNLNLKKTILPSREVQMEWNIKLYNKLFKLAQKVKNNEPDLQEYFESLDEDYKNLGYTAMIMDGKVEII
jgi:uncharacterized protein (TIGR02646 family)